MTETARTQPDFGRRLRGLRRERGLSQAQLGGHDLSVSYVSLLETGRREPTPKVLSALARTLEVDEHELLGTGPSQPRGVDLSLGVRFAQLALAAGDVEAAEEQARQLLRGGGGSAPDGAPVPKSVIVQALQVLAGAAEARGDLRQAIATLERLQSDEFDVGAVDVLEAGIGLTRCYREVGDLHRAVDVAEETLRRLRETGVPEAALTRLTSTLASAYFERGDHFCALHLLERAIEVHTPASRRERGSAYWNAAVVAGRTGQVQQALVFAERASALFAEDEDERALARLRVLRASLLLRGWPVDVTSALRHLDDAEAQLSALGHQIDLAYAETERARALVLLGRPEEGLAVAAGALHRLGDEPRLERARAELVLSQCLRSLHRRDEASAAVRRAVDQMQELGNSRDAAAVWRDLADVEAEAGDPRLAATYYRRALDQVGVRAQIQEAHRLPSEPAGRSLG
jgi:tetratricopeptide (TPR) repeat protein/DNA-binding XRE family transcriptional regulator